jgi:peptide/nickel transport system substrate-binding protein
MISAVSFAPLFASHVRRSIAASALLSAMLVTALIADPTSAAPAKGGAANLAMVAEPQTLDPMASTADLVGTIMQHVYEPLYTFDGNWNVAPMLAESMPTI